MDEKRKQRGDFSILFYINNLQSLELDEGGDKIQRT